MHFIDAIESWFARTARLRLEKLVLDLPKSFRMRFQIPSIKAYLGLQAIVVFFATGAVTPGAEIATSPGSEIKTSDRVFDFKAVGLEDPVEHTFYFENAGREPLRVSDIVATPPL